MKTALVIAAFAAASLSSLPAAAQVSTQTVVSPGATVTTTTVQSPSDTLTTKVVSTPGHSISTKLKDGTPIELDSDGSAYRVYPDGARVAAPDGVHMLIDGTSITVKDGKRIP